MGIFWSLGSLTPTGLMPKASSTLLRDESTTGPNFFSGAVAVVFVDNSETVVSRDSWEHMCSFLEDPIDSPPPIYTATFASSVVKLTLEFAALTEAGEVIPWGDELPEQPSAPPDDDEEVEQAEFQAHILNQPVTGWPARLLRQLDYKPHKLPLPPIKDLSTDGAYTTAITYNGDFFVMVLRIQHAAAGGRHVIAVTTGGSLWSAGDGLYGQLGIGLRQFGLCTPDGVVDMEANAIEE
ncbi:hypothetical protein BO82DRAFT_399501 [Aspergillus uvarum CBS 121591]|uniref:Uncharacterized protein n=1 Tax=Aspergillus uvarum CBS 121591 TaxID=1448315 RepID=A0A319D0Y7_9EURO|nr:hypothetical protein BO82DRAFT_399501 [Aspergillus uvarum CBS 121591]PYH84673.1 hypothetical protein BO82DRAFT_399501 [Aspergillus uvarum CBS 121591]